jgi:hypothetical protein
MNGWPRWLKILGFLSVGPSAFFAGEIVWEQTWLSVHRGPQMIGFSLMHSGLGLLLYLGLIVGLIWALLVVVIGIRRRSFGDRVILVLAAVYGLSWAVLSIPEGFWQRLNAETLAKGPDAGQFVAYAAARGDLKTVKAFLNAGLPVDARNELNDATPLHAAAVGGQLKVVEYLVSAGADVNSLNSYGDSPLANAESEKHQEVAAFLKAHGAQFVKGTPEQRHRSIKEQVRRSMEESDVVPRASH